MMKCKSFWLSVFIVTCITFALVSIRTSSFVDKPCFHLNNIETAADHDELFDGVEDNDENEKAQSRLVSFRDNAEDLCTESFIFSNYFKVKYVTGMSYSNILSACGSLYSFYYYLDGLGYSTPTSQNSSYNYLDIYFLNCSSEYVGYDNDVEGLTCKDDNINANSCYSTIYIFSFTTPTPSKTNTLCHEFYHTVQNLYYKTSSYVFKEGIARWVGNTWSGSIPITRYMFFSLYYDHYLSLDYYSSGDYLYSYIFDIIYDLFNNDDDTMFSFLLDFYQDLSTRVSSTITMIETISVLDSVVHIYNSTYSFEKIWFNMVVRHLGCDVPYHDYFLSTSEPNFSSYFSIVNYYGSGYMNTSVSFTDWGFRMYKFPSIPTTPYYSKVKFQMSGNHSFAIVVYDSAYSYQSVVFSNSNNYFQFTYDINSNRLSNVRFAVINLEKSALSTSLYIYQLS